jgi:hypothetical protein
MMRRSKTPCIPLSASKKRQAARRRRPLISPFQGYNSCRALGVFQRTVTILTNVIYLTIRTTGFDNLTLQTASDRVDIAVRSLSPT